MSNIELRTQAREVHRLIEDLIMQDFPVGVIETWLQEHRDELLAIYRKLTNQDDEAQVEWE